MKLAPRGHRPAAGAEPSSRQEGLGICAGLSVWCQAASSKPRFLDEFDVVTITSTPLLIQLLERPFSFSLVIKMFAWKKDFLVK